MDYLVNLVTLPQDVESAGRLNEAGVTIRRVLTPEAPLVLRWITERFGEEWAGEAAAAMSRLPPTCFLATRDQTLLGFSCHEGTARGFFGPTGVDASARGSGIGRALLFASLNDLKAMGYVYAVIGDVGPAEFYEKSVGAVPIPGSEAGIYAGRLRSPSHQNVSDD